MSELVAECIRQGCIAMVGGIGVGLVVSISARMMVYIYKRMAGMME